MLAQFWKKRLRSLLVRDHGGIGVDQRPPTCRVAADDCLAVQSACGLHRGFSPAARWPRPTHIGFVAKVAIIWTIGIIVVVIGAMLALLGAVGHAVCGHRHYF